MLNIAIDGPSGSGKSTVAQTIAKRLGIMYLDTGAMYRAMALCAIQKGVDCTDVDAVLAMLPDVRLDVVYKDGCMHVLINDADVSDKIREHAISKGASDISKIPEVRLRLVQLQREIAAKNDVVLDGRDITSYVLPRANYKFYLTASPEIRAGRRTSELQQRGQCVEYEKVLADIIDRDYNDSHRAFAPLVQTADSIYIDSSDMSADQVADHMIAIIAEGEKK